MPETAKRLRAALFARAPVPGDAGPTLVQFVDPRVRAPRWLVARPLQNDIVTAPLRQGPEGRQALLEAADAGAFHALLVHTVRALGESLAEASWFVSKIQRLGVWVVELGVHVDHVWVPVLKGGRSRGRA